MLGYLLARAGIDVIVLEKHADFLRDFRGDTIHPSTLEILDEVGLADAFLALPHSKVSIIMGRTPSGQTITFSLTRLHTRFPFIAFVPQWDFLEFMTREAGKFPTFRLLRNAEVVGLVERDGLVRGVRYRDAAGEHELLATLTVGADGRAAVTREAAQLPQLETSPAFVIPKGNADRVRAAGLDAFRRDIVATAPDLADRVHEIEDWDHVRLLTVRADRLTRWHRPGYLAIGDAAHAMSPLGGVGINIAIHDAVAAANVLWRPLREKRLTDTDLARVQELREMPVRVIQAFQGFVQTRFIKPTLDATRPPTIPFGARLLARIPILRDLPPRLVAFSIRRPHVESPRL